MPITQTQIEKLSAAHQEAFAKFTALNTLHRGPVKNLPEGMSPSDLAKQVKEASDNLEATHAELVFYIWNN